VYIYMYTHTNGYYRLFNNDVLLAKIIASYSYDHEQRGEVEKRMSPPFKMIFDSIQEISEFESGSLALPHVRSRSILSETHVTEAVSALLSVRMSCCDMKGNR